MVQAMSITHCLQVQANFLSICHMGSSLIQCPKFGFGLGLRSVESGKVTVAGPAKDDFADAAVSHRTDVSSGPRSDRPRSGSWCARLIKRVERHSNWLAS
jgi:hypothetical protein